MPTAAVVIIGNEILSGKYPDENGPYFIQRLRELGYRLRRLVVVPDVHELIADEVRACSDGHDVVFTTGGVGPTHDDITMEAVALAFGVRAVVHPELEAIIRGKIRGEVTDAALRMALAPEGAELLWDGQVRFPLVRVKNVYVLPGVPSLVRLKVEAVAHRLQGRPLHAARLRTSEYETDIAERLSQALERFEGVEIGSYPRFDEDPRHVVVTVEGEDEGRVEACASWLRARLSP